MIKNLLGIVFGLYIGLLAQDANIHHDLSVKIYPEESKIEVNDKVKINSKVLDDTFTFKLNHALKPEILNDELKLELVEEALSAKDIGMDRDDAESESSLLLNEYEVTGFDKTNELSFIIKYSGIIESPIEQSEENYQRGFSESPGIISDLGVYLAGSTYWVPSVEEELATFILTTELPSLWRTVSQGKRIKDEIENDKHIDTWDSNTPQEEIFLIAAKFNEYKFSTGSVDAFAFLRTPDEALANKYLETTAQYLEMYRQLVGPFPYTKFALVENFWETGYGMPSFTLLGEKIIRFPFILHSSYPHELLHNWWGNSVYVDFEKGNWCEGLTAYMADHLIKEQRGQAVEYRRSTLQKFTDFVNAENDFPLTMFLSRHDGASEAIGYGKALMVFHMLRQKVGDEVFKKAIQSFNRQNKFKKAAYSDIQNAFEDVTEEDLDWFFNQWINRKGAPSLQLTKSTVNKTGDQYELKFTIEQIQKEDPFILDVPVVVVDDKGTHRTVFQLKDRKTELSIKADDEPLKIMIDPQFDIMRRLDPNEIPPAFTKAYGADKSLFVLPNQSDENYDLYKEFTEGWMSGKEDKFGVVDEKGLSALPNDRTVWILGKDNKLLSNVSDPLKNYNSAIRSDSVKLAGKVLATGNNSFLISANNPDNIDHIIMFLSIGNEKAVPGLLRKLPHYGKYSYLAFEGDEPTNIEKGQWSVNNSPLIKSLNSNIADLQPTFKERAALADLAPAFSSSRMMEHIKYLASDEMKGRGIGTQELDKAAEYIADKFKEYGLEPVGDTGSYYQNFDKAFHGKGNFQLKNVIGIIPGTNSALKEAVVISAHYDHLGLGWPDVRKGNEGKVHNGADDNASGVSVMLELAKSLGKSFKPARTIIFAAFTAEEAGLIGSDYFVNNYGTDSVKYILANLNFDTVGRLFEHKLMILNGNTAREWKFIFMGTEYTTGIPAELITQELDASDQVSFIRNGIPAIQFFTGPNEDYHRPSDTYDKIDPDGLIKVASVAKEVLQYLAERKDIMNFTGSVDKSPKSKDNGSTQGRRVSTGTMPDFSYSGEGVKIAAITDGSPGEKAGLVKGDIIKKVDGKEVKTLREYSNVLKNYSPGDEIELELERAGETIKVNLQLSER